MLKIAMPFAAAVSPVIDLRPTVRHKTTGASPRVTPGVPPGSISSAAERAAHDLWNTSTWTNAFLAALLNNGRGKDTLC